MRQNTASMDASAHRRGVTLIELLMTVALVAVLYAIALPSMGRLLARSAITSTEDDLVVALQQARLRAISDNGSVLACPSDDGLHCHATRHWERGWLVAEDRNHDGQPDRPPSLRGHPHPGIHILGSPGHWRIHFHADGAAAGSNLTLTLCDPAHATAGGDSIVVSNAGRIRHGKPSSIQLQACLGTH
jgi:type IV fimbrial biogenesis protein FimT